MLLCEIMECETCRRYILDETGFHSCTGYPEGIPKEIYDLPRPEDKHVWEDEVMWREIDDPGDEEDSDEDGNVVK